jgi:hypothetical protein
MKTKKVIIAALAVILSALTIPAQNTTAQTTPPAWIPGPAWSLTAEQLAARRQMVQATLADLRAKRDAGTINATEKAWLDRMEQAGGLCVNGAPRGGGRGAGAGQCNGTGPMAQAGLCPMQNNPTEAATAAAGGPSRGRGMGWGGKRGRGWGGGFGLQNGTGPRAQDGTCPMQQAPTQ